MAKNLWELRKVRSLTVKQLAGKSGVSASKIYAYENGTPARMADLAKLAKALFVDQSEIKIQSDPKPKEKKQKPKPAVAKRPSSAPTASAPSKPQAAPPKPATKKASQSHPTATEGQINHLLILAGKLGQTETAVTEKIGQPLTELTKSEASRWLRQYTEELKALKAERPPDTRRNRYHLPEGVDAFEFNYLTARQEAGDLIAFKLFDGTELNGRIVGFSPYNITIAQSDGSETTIQKLALAYYTIAQPKEAA